MHEESRMEKTPYGPANPRTGTVSDHCVIRWIERRHSVDLDPFRRFMEVAKGSKLGKALDKAMIRTLEKGFDLRIETIREAIRHEMQAGEIVLHRGHIDLMTPSGHVLVIMRNDLMEWHVATVLYPYMTSGWNQTDDKHWLEDGKEQETIPSS
jgi:hypothetical protein